MEKSGEYDDDAGLKNRWVSVGVPVSEEEKVYLDYEDENGVLGIVSGWIGTLEDASLIGCSDRHWRQQAWSVSLC